MAARRLTAKRMMRDAIDRQDHELVAMMLVTGSLETLERLQAEQPMTVPDLYGAFSKLMTGTPEGQLVAVPSEG
jgi:hypothetical protein